MTINDFISMTQRIIARDGFACYLPTLALTQLQKILVLEGVPADVDLEGASRAWMSSLTDDDDDFILSFKVDVEHFKVVARADGVDYETIARATTDSQAV